MKVHISQTTKELLGPNYKLADRGEIEIKGKGNMKTYWLEDREYRTKLPADLTITTPVNTSLPNALEMPMVKKRPSSVISDQRRASLSAIVTLKTVPTSKPIVAEVPEVRRMYSPVTFHDVAVRSNETTPTKIKCMGRGMYIIFCYMN